jgi:1-phosphofructokinase
VIVTLTLSPSLDRTLEVGRLRRGALQRAAPARLDPGGKGVNVTRALLANGVDSRAVLPCGGPDGDELVRLLAAEAVHAVAVPIAGRTRSNVALAEADGTVTKINEPGAALSPAEFDAVADTVLAFAGRADWVVMCGSLPPATPADAYARLTARFAAAGFRVAVDTSGPALPAAAGAAPDLLKPNREELADAVGAHPADLADLGEVAAAAERLRGRGAAAVLVSLGADGAVLVDGGGVRLARAAPVEPRSTVGAGDALLAGFLAAGARGPAALAEAVAWGTAAVALPGSRMPGPGDIRRAGAALPAGPAPRALSESAPGPAAGPDR